MRMSVMGLTAAISLGAQAAPTDGEAAAEGSPVGGILDPARADAPALGDGVSRWQGGVIVTTVAVADATGRVHLEDRLGGTVDGIGQLVGGAMPRVRSTTADGEAPCEPPSAHPLAWPRGEIGFVIAGASVVTDGDARAAVRRAFATWAQSGANLSFRDDGETSRPELGFRPGQANQNLVVWMGHTWPGTDGDPAFTLVSFDCKTGKILDADVILNAKTYHFSAQGADNAIDVQNIVTHEVGHLIGLAHSPNDEASMFGHSAVGEIKKRDLTGEDIGAAREIYR